MDEKNTGGYGSGTGGAGGTGGSGSSGYSGATGGSGAGSANTPSFGSDLDAYGSSGTAGGTGSTGGLGGSTSGLGGTTAGGAGGLGGSTGLGSTGTGSLGGSTGTGGGTGGSTGGGNAQVEQVAQGLENAAHKLDDFANQQAPGASGIKARAGAMASSAADTIESAAQYLRDSDVRNLQGNLERQVRDNPLQTLLIGVAAGWVLGKILR